MASSAIPSVFPPVEIGAVPFIDGGVVNNMPISHAIELGADRIWVLLAGTACGLAKAPTSALAVALQAVSVLINRQLQRYIRLFQDRCDLHVLPPLCPVMAPPTDFGQARHLIDRADLSSVGALRSGADDHGDLAASLDHPHQH